MSKLRGVLNNKNFLLFWLGQIISQFGDRLDQMALIAFVYKRSNGSAFELAKVMSFTIIPAFLISPFAGVFVDRWNRKITMIATDLIRAALVILIPLFFLELNSFIPVYVSVFLVFSASCFFLPSKFSIIPELVSKEKLLMANSLTNITMMLAAVLGLGIGGPLIEKVGIKIGFYIDSFTYLISALFLAFIKIQNSHLKKKDINEELNKLVSRSLVKEVKEGLDYVFAQPYLRFVFSAIFMLMSAAGAIYIVSIVFIQQIFGSATKDLGILAIFIGAGFFLGTLICGSFGQKIQKVKMIFGGMIISGILIFCFVAALKIFPSFPIAAFLAILIGSCVGPIFIFSSTLIHEVIKTEMRGRIFSSLGIVMNLGFLVAMFAASKLSEVFLPEIVMGFISLCMVSYGVFGLLIVKGKVNIK